MANKYVFPGVTPPPVDPKWSDGASLGEKLESALTRFLQKLITWGWHFAADLLVDIFDQSMKILRPGALRVTAPIMAEIRKLPGQPESLRQLLDLMDKEEGETSFFWRLAIAWGYIRSIVFGGLSPLSRVADQNADVAVRSYLPDALLLSQMNAMGLITDAQFTEGLQGNGVKDILKDAVKQYGRNLPNLGDVIAGRWRGVLSDADFAALLKRMGHFDEDLKLYDELSKNIPPLTDLIHMMVREAWSDPISSKFGYDTDYPEELNEWLKKQGYDPDWGKKYWRAHWNLPSPTQAYEMLHRGHIDKSTLSELLKTADYPTFWREKLEAISFHNYTRVDVRRLVQAGILSAEEALRAYKDMGYDDEKAKKLTDFAVQGVSLEERDLTKSEIIGLYVDGVADRGATSTALVKMGYDQQEADSLLKVADLDIAKQARSATLSYVKENFLAGKFDAGAVTAELGKIGIKGNSIDGYLLAWTRQKETAVRQPTIAEAKRFYIGDIITLEEFKDVLAQNNCSAQLVEWLVKEVEKAKGAQTEEENA